MQIPVIQKSRAKRIHVRRVSLSSETTTSSVIQSKKPSQGKRDFGKQLIQRTTQNFHKISPIFASQKRGLFYAGLFLGIMVGYIGVSSSIAYAHQTVRADHIVNHAINEPIRIVFTRPVKSGLRYSWQEHIDGTWTFEKQLGGVRALVFTPKAMLAPNSVLHLQLKKVEPTADIMRLKSHFGWLS
ncbi:hypothetical protein IPP75_02725 [Candidatus Saccharibacteria bacterium]|nr:MAG: hypothetical protein IPP75_02725 [Candidatus Saccharibacteria bacterium]